MYFFPSVNQNDFHKCFLCIFISFHKVLLSFQLWGRAFLENFRNQPGRPEDDQRRSSVMGRRRNESIDQRSERYQDIER